MKRSKMTQLKSEDTVRQIEEKIQIKTRSFNFNINSLYGDIHTGRITFSQIPNPEQKYQAMEILRTRFNPSLDGRIINNTLWIWDSTKFCNVTNRNCKPGYVTFTRIPDYHYQ